MSEDIPDLLRRLPQDEEAVEWARRDFRAFCLARPNEAHVEFQRVILRRRLRELTAAPGHD